MTISFKIRFLYLLPFKLNYRRMFLNTISELETLARANAKGKRQLENKSAGKKGSKIKGEAKLCDAKDAGTGRSRVSPKNY